MFYIEVWDDLYQDETTLVNKPEFSTLIEAQNAFQPLQDANDALGLDYTYFIVDDNDEQYEYDPLSE